MDASRDARMELRNDLSELARARREVRAFLADTLEARDLNRVVLALDEAVANIMEHAYAGEDDRTIRMEMRCTPDRLIFILEDDGEPFDPTQAPLPNLKEHVVQSRDGGLGIYLFTTIMDTTHEIRESGGNRLRLERKLNREDGP